LVSMLFPRQEDHQPRAVSMINQGSPPTTTG
jgi:hypothetical protein